MRLPTSLELDSEQVDNVIDTGRHLLRNSSGYQNLLTRLRDQ